MGIDLLATGLLLPLCMTQIVSRIIEGQVRSGKLPALSAEQVGASGMHRRSIHIRSLIFAVLVSSASPLRWSGSLTRPAHHPSP